MTNLQSHYWSSYHPHNIWFDRFLPCKNVAANTWTPMPMNVHAAWLVFGKTNLTCKICRSVNTSSIFAPAEPRNTISHGIFGPTKNGWGGHPIAITLIFHEGWDGRRRSVRAEHEWFGTIHGSNFSQLSFEVPRRWEGDICGVETKWSGWEKSKHPLECYFCMQHMMRIAYAQTHSPPLFDRSSQSFSLAA